MASDRELLDRFVRAGDGEAFGQIVRRHADAVYTACLRVLENPHAAEDAAQATFLVLMRKARALGGLETLAGWLVQAAHLSALASRRAEARRARHEREVLMKDPIHSAARDGPEPWEEVRAHLDTALAALGAEQRDAVALRYLHGFSQEEAAREAGCSVGTLSMRAARGLDKIRGFLRRRGVSISSGALGALLIERAVEAAPAHLTSSITATCLAGAGGAAAVAPLADEVLRGMASAAAKKAAGWTAVVIGSLGLLGTGAQWLASAGKSLPAVIATTASGLKPISTGPAPIVPAGAHRFVTLELEKAIPAAPAQKGAAPGLPVTLTLWMHVRDGKAVRCVASAPQLNPRAAKGRRLVCQLAELDAAPLMIGDASIQGEIRGEFELDGTWPASYTLQVTIRNDALTGTYTGRITSAYLDKKITPLLGAVSGRVRAGAQLQAANVLSPGKGWPAWNGPNANFTATDTPALQLVDDLKDARLVWYSEEVLRHGISWDCPGHGGFSSPIVADGKVFFNQYRGSGSVLTTQGADTQDPHVSADDEVICIDAATGRTLWKQVFAGKSINGPLRDKHCLHNNTGCYDKGRVYMLGFTWRVYCLDANTGKFIWESHLGEAHLDAERQKRQALEKRAIINLIGDENKFLSSAGGVVFCNNLRGGIVAFDAETGETRWVVLGSLPTRWVHEGREYILAADSRYGREIRCLDPQTGRALWTAEVGRSAGGWCWLTSGDLVLANPSGGGKPKPEGGGIEPLRFDVLRIGPAGVARVCTATLADFPSFPPATPIYGGCAFVRRPVLRYDAAAGRSVPEGSPLVGVELAAGTPRGEVPKETPFYAGLAEHSFSLAADGRCFYEMEGTSGITRLVMVDAKTLKPLQTDWWNPPHRQTGGHDYPVAWPYVEGRLFIRGWEGIYCYDLRKSPGP
jgi:RNA polymerase sigma factor (sigma-70 family)